MRIAGFAITSLLILSGIGCKSSEVRQACQNSWDIALRSRELMARVHAIHSGLQSQEGGCPAALELAQWVRKHDRVFLEDEVANRFFVKTRKEFFFCIPPNHEESRNCVRRIYIPREGYEEIRSLSRALFSVAWGAKEVCRRVPGSELGEGGYLRAVAGAEELETVGRDLLHAYCPLR